jgi:hypothetical protein
MSSTVETRASRICSTSRREAAFGSGSACGTRRLVGCRSLGRVVERASSCGSRGEAVDEEVEQELEALVGVGGGDVVGEFDEVGEAVAGERGEVVASDGGGVVWRGLVGRWLAAFAGSSIANPMTIEMSRR